MTPRGPGRLPRLGAGLACALLLVTGCSGSDEDGEPGAGATSSSAAAPSEAAATPRPAKPAPRPEARACYRLSYDQAVAPTNRRPPVPCADSHTAFTFAVGRLDALAGGHLLAVDSAQVQDQVADTCPRRFDAFVGGTLDQRRLSQLRAVWFTPTVRQSDRGADWYRCDVIALGGPEQLEPLGGALAGVLDTEAGRARWGTCGTAEPGTDGFERVVCSAEAASWEAMSVVPLAQLGPDYPGEGTVTEAGQTPCEDAGRAAADDALNFRWSYEYPTPDQWRSGQTYGVCWAPR